MKCEGVYVVMFFKFEGEIGPQELNAVQRCSVSRTCRPFTELRSSCVLSYLFFMLATDLEVLPMYTLCKPVGLRYIE